MGTATATTHTMARGPSGTRPDRGSAGGHWSRWPRALLAIAFGGVLVALAAPRLLASLALLPADPVLDAVQSGEPIDAGLIAALISSREQARRFVSAPEIDVEIGMAEVLQAEAAPPDSAERRVALDRAIESLRAGLARAPRASFAWAKLAYAIQLRNGMSKPAIDAWHMSIETAPAEPRLVLWRSEFGAAALPLLDVEDQGRVAQQMRHAWRFDREGLARLARDRGLQLVLRRVLSGEPDVAELNRLFAEP